MKILSFLIAATILCSCSSSTKTPSPSGLSYVKVDSPQLTVAEFADPGGFAVIKERVFRQTKDSFVIGSNEWVKDTLYFMPVADPIKDSSKKGEFKKDSLGNVKYTITWRQLPKEYVLQDFGKRFSK